MPRLLSMKDPTIKKTATPKLADELISSFTLEEFGGGPT